MAEYKITKIEQCPCEPMEVSIKPYYENGEWIKTKFITYCEDCTGSGEIATSVLLTDALEDDAVFKAAVLAKLS